MYFCLLLSCIELSECWEHTIKFLQQCLSHLSLTYSYAIRKKQWNLTDNWTNEWTPKKTIQQTMFECSEKLLAQTQKHIANFGFKKWFEWITLTLTILDWAIESLYLCSSHFIVRLLPHFTVSLNIYTIQVFLVW